MFTKKIKNRIQFILTCSPLLLTTNAMAEEESVKKNSSNIEKIQIVSSTKRAENIQDVPVSVALVTSETLDKVGISDMEDLSILIPNFEINSSGILPNLYVRGLGGSTSHIVEQSVGRFVDDVYISRAAINLHPFLDVQAVEVLRGPQGTLFGKNTAAGALIIRTNDAQSDLGYGINLSTSSYSTTGGNNQIDGYVTGAISENVDARLAFLYRDKDGFYKNTLDGPDGAQREDIGIRGKLLWQASEKTTVGIKLEHMEYDSLGSDTAEIRAFGGPPLAAWQQFATNSGADGSTVTEPKLDWIVHYNCGEATDQEGISIGAFCPSRDQEYQNVTLNIDHEMDGGTLTLITGYQTYEYDSNFHGLDLGISNFFRANRHEKFDGISQEIRFTSTANDVFDYIVGVFYENSTINRGQTSDLNLKALNGPKLTREEPWEQDTETYAVFGQARWKFTEDVTAIIGGRWSTEEKDFTFRTFFRAFDAETLLGPDTINITDTRSESKFTPSFTLQWNGFDNVNLFSSYSQGHKTGGFSDRIDNPNADIQFDAEIVTSLEFGAKATLLDGSLNLNVTVFKMDIEGLQLATQAEGATVPEFSVDNAADSSSDGVEVELFWYAHEDLTLGGNFSYTDATYDEFIGSAACDERFKNVDDVCDLSGQSLIYAPKNKAAVFAEYTVGAFSDSEIMTRIDIAYSGEYYTDITNSDNVFQESFTTYNASVRWISPDGDLTVSLLGKNLTNERILAWGILSGPNTLASMAPPREVSLKLSYRY